MISRVFDAHVDTLMRVRGPKRFLRGSRRTQLDVPRASAAGVTDLVTAICAEAEKDPLKGFRRGYENYLAVVDDSPIRLYLMLEGCQPLLDDPDALEVIGDLKIASLTWNGINGLGGGIGSDQGLTDAGRSMARRLRESGVVLDVSHLCDRSRRELLGTGQLSVATHCNCRAVHDFPRNLPDDDLKEIAGSGGVIGITFVPDFLSEDATIEDIIRHLEYLVDLVGIEGAGFGSDFDGIGRLPEGVEDCSVWPRLLEMLEGRGWSGEDISRVAWGNWSRVLQSV